MTKDSMIKVFLEDLNKHQSEPIFFRIGGSIKTNEQKVYELESYEDRDINNKKCINITNVNSEINEISIEEENIISIIYGTGDRFKEVDYRIDLIGGISVYLSQPMQSKQQCNSPTLNYIIIRNEGAILDKLNELKVIQGGKRVENYEILGTKVKMETNIPKQLLEKMMTIGLNNKEVVSLEQKGLLDFQIIE